MFLRISALIMLLLVPFYAESVLSPTDRYEFKDAETDIKILKSILTRKPGDLQTLERLINLTFTLEYFDQTEKYCEQYLSIKADSETAYLKIIAAASQGKFKYAADQIDPFINSYKTELSRKDISMLKYRESLYRKSTSAAGYPSGTIKTSWGDNLLIKTLIPRDGIITAYDYRQHIHKILKINGGSVMETVNYPDYLSDTSPESLISVSLSPDGREVMAGLHSGDTTLIYTRVYLPAKKRWSSWYKPGALNPGKWNHYPNFVNSSTIIFSSSDGENYDIYISQKDEDGDWGRPEKLTGINTPLDEISVFVHPDGETVYFSSNGYEGHGGFDIYSAKLKHKDKTFEVSEIKNLSSANTFRNEKYPLYLSLSGNSAFYNFTAGKNHYVYWCPKLPFQPVPVFYYNAEVADEISGNPVKEAVAEYKSQAHGFTEKKPVYSDGFTGTVLRKNMKYIISITAEGYEHFSKTISYPGKDNTVNDKILLRKKSVRLTKPVTTLITAIKLINCEESAVRPVHELLEMKIGLKQVKADTVKNILSYTPCGDISCAVNDGKAVKAEYVVFGTLSKTKQSGMKTLGDTGEDQYLAKKISQTVYTLELKLLDTATGKVITSHKKSTANTGTLKSITQEFISKTESVYTENK
jgi:hypothetical protein